MSRGKGRAKDAAANATPEEKPAEETPEVPAEQETASDPTAAPDEQEKAAASLVEQDPYDRLEGRTPEEAVAAPLGAPDDYPYLDKTSMPLHERNLPMTTDAGGPSQAELNPAFYPKAEDGGPTTANDEGIGTEPNIHDQMLAAAKTAEENGQEGAVEQTEKQIAEGQEQQMDAQAVTDAAQERAPEGIDAATGQPEGQATPPGAPSGMEEDSKANEESVEVAGTPEGSSPEDGDEDNLKTPGAESS